MAGLFASEGVFGGYIVKGWIHGMAGWLEAMAIQLPETYQLEIDQVVPASLDDETIRAAFLGSLAWRNINAFSSATSDRLDHLLEGEDEIAFEALNAVMETTTYVDHPYNADWLDACLRPLAMAERDIFWSVYLVGQLRKDTRLRRLLEWAWAERENCRVPDEVARLTSLTLTWCLTTSDRRVRDRATKSLVALLQQRIRGLSWLLGHFRDLAEPYLQERLLAVAYGCAMTTSQENDLQSLAQDVYDRFFRNGNPPPSVLSRDHARGIVETAVRRGLTIDYDATLIVPPFRSKWARAPSSLNTLRRRYHTDDYEPHQWAPARIFDSVTEGDFARYIINDVTMWDNRRFHGLRRLEAPLAFRELLADYSEDSAGILKQYVDSLRRLDSKKETDAIGGLKPHHEFVESAEPLLPHILGKRKARHFQAKILPYLIESDDTSFKHSFSVEMFQRLILRRVLQLGGNLNRLSEFDRSLPYRGRQEHEVERIGKKYQWIAYDELHARISDNFGPANRGMLGMSPRDWHKGFWPMRFRDIDPSLLLKQTPRDGRSTNYENWWTPCKYDKWMSRSTPLEWIKATDDLPDPQSFLSLRGPDEASWISLHGYAEWQRMDRLGTFLGQETDHQEVHYIFRSYITRRDDLPIVLKWARKQDWINDRLPSPSHIYRQYLHEHFSSSHFDQIQDDDWITEVWPKNDLPRPVLPTTSEYFCERGSYDHSLDSTVSICMPSCWLAQKLGVRLSGRRGDYVDEVGHVVAYDPSIREAGQGTLLVRRDCLWALLEREDLGIFWTLLGEKNAYPPEQRDGWLGRLTILGVYTWDGREIKGGFRTEFTDGYD